MSLLGNSAFSEVPLSTLPGAGGGGPSDETERRIRHRRAHSWGYPEGARRGRVVRTGVSPDDEIIVENIRVWVRGMHSPVHPHPQQLRGRVLRRDGVSSDISPDFWFPRGRLKRAPQLHPSTLRGHSTRREGRTPLWFTFEQTYDQGFRVADLTLARYELFVGVDGPPDFDAPPEAVSFSLPFTWAPPVPLSGTSTFHVVVRRRNKYDLQSFNVHERLLVIDAAGDPQPELVSAPRDVAVYDEAEGEIRVVAKYVSSDDVSPADTWEVFVGVGVEPVPGVDVAAFEGDMTFLGVESGLSILLDGYTAGQVLHVVVVAKRDSDSERGIAAEVLHTVPATLDLEDASLFGGQAYEQVSTDETTDQPAILDVSRVRRIYRGWSRPFAGNAQRRGAR